MNYLKIMMKVVREDLLSLNENRFVDVELWTVGRSMFQDMLSSFPGIDEAVSFSEVMKYDRSILVEYLSREINV